MAPRQAASYVVVPFAYRIFFLVIEPIAALVGAFYAHFRQEQYLAWTHASSAQHPTPLGTSVVASQLANLYLLFAVNEALVLRATSDQRVWKTLLFGLLIADFGHLYSLSGLGSRIYWDFASWNAIDWGNVPFVYIGATMRVSFLAGVGLGSKSAPQKAARA
jgi:hypothetical protein